MTTGERIRSIRKSRGLTQKQLGELSRIAEPTIRRYELGKLNPKLETIQKIADALNIDVLELVQIEPIPNNPISEKAVTELMDRIAQAKQEGEGIRIYNGGVYIVKNMADSTPALLDSFHQLNELGQEEAVKRVEELTEIPRYQKGKSPTDGN